MLSNINNSIVNQMVKNTDVIISTNKSSLFKKINNSKRYILIYIIFIYISLTKRNNNKSKNSNNLLMKLSINYKRIHYIIIENKNQ